MFCSTVFRLIVICCAMAGWAPVAAASFSFVALGDTAYCPGVDYPRYARLIDRINAAGPAFSVHVGDTGLRRMGICSEEAQAEIAAQFARFDHPLIYTPGDNEWTDCLPDADPLERLQRLRERFFSAPTSLGAKPMPVVRQSDESDDKTMVENLRWSKEGVVFATVHVVGSHNGLSNDTEAALLEYHARNLANIAWVRQTFARARAESAPAVVLVFHADMDWPVAAHSPGYSGLRSALRAETANFDGQVLMVNGDSHDFVIDKPFLDATHQHHMNVTRLVVDGAPSVRAVRVSVEPDTPWVFGFASLFEKGEGRTMEQQRQCDGEVQQ